MAKQQKKGSQIARKTAARLAAVQAVYQMDAGGHEAEQAARDYMGCYAGMEIEGEQLLFPDEKLFSAVVRGVADRREDLDDLLNNNITKNEYSIDNKKKNIDSLLWSIMLCGSFELLAHHDIDPPIIIADYLNVTRAFYEKGETALVNAVLDAVSKGVRD